MKPPKALKNPKPTSAVAVIQSTIAPAPSKSETISAMAILRQQSYQAEHDRLKTLHMEAQASTIKLARAYLAKLRIQDLQKAEISYDHYGSHHQIKIVVNLDDLAAGEMQKAKEVESNARSALRSSHVPDLKCIEKSIREALADSEDRVNKILRVPENVNLLQSLLEKLGV